MKVSCCFPKSHFSTGMLEFPISTEILGKFELTLLTASTIALYPIIGVITIIAEIFFSLNSLYHFQKVKKHVKPIPSIQTHLDILRDKRVAKLESQERAIPERVKVMTKKQKAELLRNYESTEATDYTSAILKGKLERNLLPILFYEKIQAEKDSYQDISETVTKRHVFAILRHKIAIKINIHYMKNLSKLLIPGIGLYWLLSSKETTQDYFQKGSNKTLAERYNKMIKETPWLKAY